MTIRCIIIDDEKLARNALRHLLSKCNNHSIAVLASCGDVPTAVKLIEKHRPDLIFLDINMPCHDGFSLIRVMDKKLLPHIIFVTAYSQYAVKGFEVNAVDYLLKPIKLNRLIKSLDRVCALINNRNKFAKTITIKDSLHVTKLVCDEIISIDAAGNYMCINTTKKTWIQRTTLKAIYEKLDIETFFQIHRSIIINKDHVNEIISLGNSRYKIKLSNNCEVISSTSYRNHVKAMKNKIVI